jgi:hypothetical protein
MGPAWRLRTLVVVATKSSCQVCSDYVTIRNIPNRHATPRTEELNPKRVKRLVGRRPRQP